MALNIKNIHVERLVRDVAAMAGETKTQAVRRSLEERKERLAAGSGEQDRRARLHAFMEREIWAQIPRRLLGRRMTKKEREAILGYGPHGL